MQATTRFIWDGGDRWLRINRTEAHYFAQVMSHRAGRALEPVSDLRDSVRPDRRAAIERAVDGHIRAFQEQAA